MTVVRRRPQHPANGRTTSQVAARGGFIEGHCFDVERVLVSAILFHGDLQSIQDAGIDLDDFDHEDHHQSFEFIVRHTAQHGRVPDVRSLQANWPNYKVYRCPEPIAFYIDRFLHAQRYDLLGRGVSEIAERLADNDVDEAFARFTDLVSQVEQVSSKGRGGHEVVWGHDLLQADEEPVDWLVEGVWVNGSYGMLGGEEKSLKSYLVTSLCLAVASGMPWLGHFEVPRPRPVLVLVGEGGEKMYGRRLRRMAKTMGITSDDIEQMLVLDFKTRPLDTRAALDELGRQVRRTNAALVVIDPWYAYHGHGTNAASIFEEGSLLTDLRDAVGPDVSLLILHHFNRTGGKGSGLRRLSMAGAAEWSDSWITVKKTSEDVEEGVFELSLAVGSRQWGGSAYEVGMEIGRLDPETHQHVGEIAWAVARATLDAESTREDSNPAARLVELVENRPGHYTKTSLAKEAGGNKQRVLAQVQTLLDDGTLTTRPDRRSSRKLLLYPA